MVLLAWDGSSCPPWNRKTQVKELDLEARL